MRFPHLLICTTLLVNFCQSVLHQIDLIESLVDEYYGRSTVLSAFICNKHESMALIKRMSAKNRQVNILSLERRSLRYPIPPHHTLYLLDLKCPNSTYLLQEANKEKLFSKPLKWLAYLDGNSSPEKLSDSFFQNIDILVDSDVTIILEKELGKSYNLKKIFKQHLESEVITEDVGEWSSENGLNITMDDHIVSRRRRDLMGVALKTSIVITNNDSLNHLSDKRDPHIDSIAKVNYVLVEHLSNIVNATLSYDIESSWGYKNNQSEWSGMIGKLTRNEADIGGTALFLTVDRISIIDYIAMTTPTRSKFVFRQPKLSYVTNVFVLPFDRNVWESIIASLFVIALVLFIVIKWEWKKKEIVDFRNESNGQELHDSWLETLFITFGAMCQQGASSMPYSFPGRITVVFLFVSFMFLYTSYSANIVALLQSSSTSIQTLEDILNSRLEVGVDDTIFNHFYFPNATEPIRRAIYLKKVAPPGQKERFYKIHEGIAKMRAGLFAFHVETGPGYKIVSETFQEGEKCGLQEIQYLQVPDPWLAIQKNSSYKEMLKIGLHQLQENGIQAREVGLIYTKKPQCLSRGAVFVNVGLVDCYAALVILVGGIFIAVLVLILEIYFKTRVKKYRRKIMKRRQGRKYRRNMDLPTFRNNPAHVSRK